MDLSFKGNNEIENKLEQLRDIDINNFNNLLEPEIEPNEEEALNSDLNIDFNEEIEKKKRKSKDNQKGIANISAIKNNAGEQKEPIVVEEKEEDRMER